MYYVKVAREPQMWFVNSEGERTALASSSDIFLYGMQIVKIVSPEELEEIPIEGENAPLEVEEEEKEEYEE